MVLIRQLTKTSDLQRGNQLLVGDASAAYNSQYPRKSSIWLLIQYLSTGVFQYLSIRDWFKVPGVPFADLPDPEGLLGARAFCTDAARVPDALLTVGKGSGIQWGYSVFDGLFGTYGSLSNTTFSPNGGTIIALTWIDTTLLDGMFLVLEGDYPDSGWNTIVVNGDIFTRSSAVYDNSTPGITSWSWNPSSNPFGSEGDVEDIYFGTTGIEFNDPIGGGGSANIPVFSDNVIWRAG